MWQAFGSGKAADPNRGAKTKNGGVPGNHDGAMMLADSLGKRSAHASATHRIGVYRKKKSADKRVAGTTNILRASLGFVFAAKHFGRVLPTTQVLVTQASRFHAPSSIHTSREPRSMSVSTSHAVIVP